MNHGFHTTWSNCSSPSRLHSASRSQPWLLVISKEENVALQQSYLEDITLAKESKSTCPTMEQSDIVWLLTWCPGTGTTSYLWYSWPKCLSWISLCGGKVTKIQLRCIVQNNCFGQFKTSWKTKHDGRTILDKTRLKRRGNQMHNVI